MVHPVRSDRGDRERVTALQGSRFLSVLDELVGVAGRWDNTYEMEVDARLLGRPPRFPGTDTELSDCSFQARAYFDRVSQSMADQIDAVEANVDRAIPLNSLNDGATENAWKMFYALTMMPQGPPLLLLKKVGRGNGFEA